MYTIYSILSLVFVILIIVTAFITIALTYFQLAVEDHGWWWRSFLCGGSTGAHMPSQSPASQPRLFAARQLDRRRWQLSPSFGGCFDEASPDCY